MSSEGRYTRLRRTGVALLLLAASAAGQASLGPYEHGNGIKAMGAGGVSYVGGEETTALAGNPAHSSWLGTRYDVGVDLLHPYTEATDFSANALAPDGHYPSDGRGYYPVPQGGVNFVLGPRWSVGMSMLFAGLGTDYPKSPYERFGGARRASLMLGSASIASALGYRLNERHSIGLGLLVGYQTIQIEGVQFLGSSDPQARVSRYPENTTNMGKDGSFNIAWSAGWTGHLTEQVLAGVAYRSKSWTQKHREYRGLLPDGGSLELPAVYGAALAYDVLPQLRALIEWQRYELEGERALGNRLSNLSSGTLLGSQNGPGFGLRNQQAWKMGLIWDAVPNIRLRAGYVHSTQPVRGSETLFAALAPITITTHYTGGATYTVGDWEWSGFATFWPEQKVRQENSIPAAFGGGTATARNGGAAIGFSIGRRFGAGTAIRPEATRVSEATP